MPYTVEPNVQGLEVMPSNKIYNNAEKFEIFSSYVGSIHVMDFFSASSLNCVPPIKVQKIYLHKRKIKRFSKDIQSIGKSIIR